MGNDILVQGGDQLLLFADPIVIDNNLLKWKNYEKKRKNATLTTTSDGRISDNDKVSIDMKTILDSSIEDFTVYVGKFLVDDFKHRDMGRLQVPLDTVVKKTKTSLYRKVERFWNKITATGEEEEVVPLDVVSFFEEVKLSLKANNELYVKRVEPYLVALYNASEMGQQALIDRIVERIFCIKYESILLAEGFNKKITEEQLVYFVKHAEKGVRLDYIKNFTDIIPENVIAMKTKVDKLQVFDNYCVLHYDPDLKSYSMTIAEKEDARRKKSDPILFGLISGSTDLYYIADWVNDKCDLTLDEFMKVSGFSAKALEINPTIKLVK